MSTITYVRGDATSPIGADPAIIAHIVNDVRAWGSGFVVSVSRKWTEPERFYRSVTHLVLGDMHLVPVSSVTAGRRILVANMVAQHGLRSRSNPVPLDYPAVEKALEQVARSAGELGASVHMPRIGCGLAGGRWNQVEPLIEATCIAGGVGVVVYDLAG